MSRLGWAWLALCGAFATHVFDENATGFLSVYNPTVIEMRHRFAWFPMPTFEHGEWLRGLIGGVALVFLLSPFAFRGARWLRPLAYFLAGVMLLNGLGHTLFTIRGHTVQSVRFPRPAAGILVIPAAHCLVVVAVPRVAADANAFGQVISPASARLRRMQQKAAVPGTLYVVGTPIGNLEDITLRALRVLKEADLIACEDTRQTQKLLQHHGVSTRTISYHEHNEAERATELVAKLAAGASIALVTDAGMPAVSDPGYRVITLAIGRGIPVVPIPGTAAFLCALAASGLPTDAFLFAGFLPSKSGQRRQVLEKLRDAGHTTAFYEAPHRIVEALEDVVETLGAGRRVVVAREVTKLHEEFIRGSAEEVLRVLRERAEVKGEITLLIARAEGEPAAALPKPGVRERMRQLLRDEHLEEKDALKKLAKEMGVSKSEVYRLWQRSR